jgi:putative phosphoesterase
MAAAGRGRESPLAHPRASAILKAPEVSDTLPKIGLLSDSHGRATTTRRAVEVLLKAGVDCLIHLGDVGSLEVIDELVVAPPGRPKPLEVRLVFGNVDWDRESMAHYAAHLGLVVDDPVGHLKLDEGTRELVFLHGDDALAMTAALAGNPAYLCHGHSHRPRDERAGATRIINPGALFRAQSYTVAVLDTARDVLTFLPVDEAGG